MTTLIDDGLLEDYFEDPVSLDLDQPRVIDIDDIDATIEDPGFLVEEPLDSYNEHDQKEESSYGKQSFILPVTFFDISRNILLLQKCRPISVKIVDCGIYPWYYQKRKHYTCDENSFGVNEENFVDKQIPDTSIIERPQVKYDRYLLEKPTLSSTQQNICEFISFNQREAILKLEEDIEKHIRMKTNDNDTEKCIYNKNTTSLNETDRIITENNLNKGIEPNNLLVYKAIAESIVRNADKNETNCKMRDLSTGNYNKQTSLSANFCNENKELGCLLKSNNITGNKESANLTKSNNGRHENEKVSEKTITSPILPCSVKSKRKTSPKEKTSIISVINRSRTYKTCNSNQCCKKITLSTKQVIPHYHYQMPVTVSTSNNFCCAGHSQRSSQTIYENSGYYHYLQDNTATKSLSPSQPVINNSVCNNDYNLAQYFQSFASSINSVNSNTPSNFKQTCNNTPSPSWPSSRAPSYSDTNRQVIDNSKNVNRIVQTPNPQHNRIGTGYIPSHSDHIIVDNENRVNINGANQTYIPSYRNPLMARNSTPYNQYGEMNYLRIPLQTNTANIQNALKNPMLRELLNCQSNVSPNYYYPSTQFAPNNQFQHYNIPNNYTQKYEQNQYCSNLSSLGSKLPSHMNSNEKVCPANHAKEDRVSNFVTLCKNSNPDTSKTAKSGNNLNTISEIMNTNVLYNNKSPLSGLSANKSSGSVIHDSFTQSNRALNPSQQFGKSELPQFQQNNNELRNYIALKPLQFKKDKCVLNNEILPKIKAYSPAILPIPTFKKGLEILSKSNEYRSLNTKKNEKSRDILGMENINKDTDFIRKRKINDNENSCTSNIKKISLQEYKRRIIKTGDAGANSSLNIGSDDFKGHQKGNQYVHLID